jgi:DNA-binding NarL/FixJ family response regulator
MELTFSPAHVPAMSGKAPVRLMLALVPSDDWSGHGASASAQGYVLNHDEPHELLAAIRALTAGIAPRSEGVAHTVMVRMLHSQGEDAELYELSPRETDVLRELVAGLSYKMIADKLGISFETVRTHMKRIYEKMRVHNGAEAVAKALKSGLMH